jgi:cyclic pyranopterin phosphate synthase
MAKKNQEQFTHIDSSGNPKMVDVSEKKITMRIAKAQAVVHLGKRIISEMKGNELITKKGPVFQTAIIAGVMGAKKTSDLIPFCHPLGLDDCQIKIDVKKDRAIISSTVKITSKTGVEMEALTGATVAALTVYDMCKALSHDIVIEEIKLMEKSGGKNDFKR